MQGKWLTPTRKAYLYSDRVKGGWTITLLWPDFGTVAGYDGETFWYPTWAMAVKAIPELWRH